MWEARGLSPAVAAVLARECLDAAGAARLQVSGSCLEPRLLDGERVRLEPPAVRPPRFGDLVLAPHPDGLRLHRVVWPLPGLRSRRLRTQADRSPCPDAALGPSAVLATVAGIERAGGWVAARDRWAAARSLARFALSRLARLAPIRSVGQGAGLARRVTMRKLGGWLLGAGLLLTPGVLWAADTVTRLAGCCGCPICK